MKTLIFDLDETLIHSTLLTASKPEEINKDFEIALNSGAKYSISVRPYMTKCLAHLAQYYEMAVFTAAEQSYADKIIDYLDPNKEFFSHRLYR